jgi:hypothetical protein
MLRSLAVGSLVLALLPSATAPAAADDGPVQLMPGIDGTTKEVLLKPKDPGDPGATSGGGRGTSSGTRSAATRTCTHMGEKIDCTGSFGVWSQADECWVQRMSPQPPADDPLWGGRTEGTIYGASLPR